MDEKKRGLAEIHLAVLLFGIAGLFGKFLALNSVVIVFGRVFFASFALLILIFAYKQSIVLKKRKDFLSFTLLGIILAIHWGTFFYSIQISTVAIGLIAFSTFPVFVVFLEPLMLHERLRSRDVLIALITFLGVALIIPSYELGNQITQGALWGLVSGGTFAVLSILNRKHVKVYSSLVIALYQDMVAAIVLLPFVIYLRPVITVHDLLLLILLGTLFTAIAHSLFIKGMTHVKAKTASVIVGMESLYGIFFAALLLAEIPSIRTILGGTIVLAASLYASLTTHKEGTD